MPFTKYFAPILAFTVLTSCAHVQADHPGPANQQQETITGTILKFGKMEFETVRSRQQLSGDQERYLLKVGTAKITEQTRDIHLKQDAAFGIP